MVSSHCFKTLKHNCPGLTKAAMSDTNLNKHEGKKTTVLFSKLSHQL